MAIDKKLIHFKTWENFISSTGVNGNYTTPSSGTEDDGTAIYGQVRGTSIVFIKDVGKIWTHGKLYDNSIEIDEVLSDTSTNPVTSKAIKDYVDLHPQYEAVDEIDAPEMDFLVTESTVTNWGFTKNEGTVTGVKINGNVKNSSNGVIDLGTVITAHQDISDLAKKTDLNVKQDSLVSGTNIKTVNGQSILGSGNIVTPTTTVDTSLSTSSTNPVQNKVINTALNKKQDTLTSGTNIKTINGESILGSGNINVAPEITVDSTLSAASTNPIQNKAVSIALDNKVDKVTGKRLSTEDFTTALKTKLESLTNYDDTAIQNAVNGLTTQLNTLVNGDASTAIESFNEIIAFLNGVTDSENLDSIIASIEQQIAGKMDAVTLAKVATSGSYNDLNDKPTIPAAVTESTVSGWGFTKNTGTYSKPSAGIPKSDLASDVQASLGKADSAIQNVKTINGESIIGEGNIEVGVDTSTLATKEELAEAEEVTAAALNELNDRIIEATENFITKEGLESDIAKVNESIVENEEIIAAALNDLDNRKANKEYVNDLVDRKADKEYVEDALANLDIDIDTSTLVTKDEFAEVEEVWSASYNQLIQKVTDVQQYIYNEAASRRQFDEAIAEIEAIIAENESVITAAWNQLKTRIDALETALRQGE